MALQPFGPWPLFQFLNLHTVVRTPWTGEQPVARPLPSHRTIQTQSKRTQTSMSRVAFEPTIPEFERMKTVYILDRAATVIGFPSITLINDLHFQSYSTINSLRFNSEWSKLVRSPCLHYWWQGIKYFVCPSDVSFSPSTSISAANSCSIEFFIFIYHPGFVK
jgi:hypothetical protein